MSDSGECLELMRDNFRRLALHGNHAERNKRHMARNVSSAAGVRRAPLCFFDFIFYTSYLACGRSRFFAEARSDIARPRMARAAPKMVNAPILSFKIRDDAIMEITGTR